jgi:hypothetical protein
VGFKQEFLGLAYKLFLDPQIFRARLAQADIFGEQSSIIKIYLNWNSNARLGGEF